MALTLESERRLQKARLTDLFDQNRAEWQAAAKSAYEFATARFPAKASIRPDDVAKFLKPVLEVDDRLQDALSSKKLKQKYWVNDFTDLIIDRVWDQIR